MVSRTTDTESQGRRFVKTTGKRTAKFFDQVFAHTIFCNSQKIFFKVDDFFDSMLFLMYMCEDAGNPGYKAESAPVGILI